MQIDQKDYYRFLVIKKSNDVRLVILSLIKAILNQKYCILNLTSTFHILRDFNDYKKQTAAVEMHRLDPLSEMAVTV